MSLESVNLIKSAEGKAADIISIADKKYKEMISEAIRNGEKHCEKVENDVNAELKVMIDKFNRKANELVDSEQKQAVDECKQINLSAAPQIRKAVKTVVWGILEKCQ